MRQRVEIHFHHGTRECAARVVFRDRDKLAPGETALAELRFKEPMVGVFGDHCVLRAYSPLRTVAGGLLVSPLPPELRAKDPELSEKLRLLQELPELRDAAETTGGGKAEAKARDESRAALVRGALTLCGADGADEARLRALTGLARSTVEAALQLLSTRGDALCWDKENRCWTGKIPFEKLLAACLARGADLHRREPLKPGFTRGALCTGWSRNLPPKLVQKVLDMALKQGDLVIEGEGLRLQSHTVSLAADQAGLRQKLLEAHSSTGMTPPNAKDVLEELGVSLKEAAPVLRLLCESGDLVKIKDGLYYHGPALADILERVRGWFATHDNLDVGGLKELLGLSRKYLIALLEYMDNERITVRVGDQRRYRGR